MKKKAKMSNLLIQGIDDIKSFQIIKEDGAHDILRLTCRVKLSEIIWFEKRRGEKITVREGDHYSSKVLFGGIVTELRIYKENASWYCDLTALSKTWLLDREEHTAVYQDTEKTLRSMINQIYETYGFSAFFPDLKAVSEKRPDIIMQYKETDWSFLKRICGECGIRIYSSANEGVESWFGRPERRPKLIQAEDITEIESSHSRSRYSFISKELYKIGDLVNYNKKEYVIDRIILQLKNDYLYKMYSFSDQQIISEKGLSIKGLALSAKVLSIRGEGQKQGMIQVCFDVEGSAPGNPAWIPWATMYSSKNTGVYCMPEIGEKVNVKFLDDDCRQICAENNIRTSDIPDNINTTDKIFRVGSKEILISDEVIKISNENSECCLEKDKIVLSTEKGRIEISDVIRLGNQTASIELEGTRIRISTKGTTAELDSAKMELDTTYIKIHAGNIDIR